MRWSKAEEERKRKRAKGGENMFIGSLPSCCPGKERTLDGDRAGTTAE
jgi:hypothetical protein